MTELLVIIALLIFIGYQEWQNRKERKNLIDAYLAKNLTELKQAEQIDKEKVRDVTNEMPPDFIPMEDLSDEEFTKAIHKELDTETIVDKAKESLLKGLRRTNGR